jgi:hypothetical protein
MPPMICDMFLRHPETQGESYSQHARFASGLGMRMVLTGLAALVHALLPFLFTTTASRMLAQVQARLEARGH